MQPAPSPDCQRCPRLVALRREVRTRYPDYHAAPVLAWGPPQAALLIVGLAPGMHGANASGRPFTGDRAGDTLFRALYDHGFSSACVARRAHGHPVLCDCRLTNAVKCLPPDNRPVAAEFHACGRFLAAELRTARVVLALGGLAHRAVVRGLGLRQKEVVFAHGAEHALGGARLLIDCYHCSRYNTQTGRLTAVMLDDVFRRARAYVDGLRADTSAP